MLTCLKKEQKYFKLKNIFCLQLIAKDRFNFTTDACFVRADGFRVANTVAGIELNLDNLISIKFF